MALPSPAPGLVISYAYLWLSQQVAGQREGRKDRPCAIVIATRDSDGDTLVYVAPITHVRPVERGGVELPTAVKRRLGLDSARSWIVTTELNRFIWPGYDLRPISREIPSLFHWGFLPTEIFDAVKRGIVEHQRARDLGIVGRE